MRLAEQRPDPGHFWIRNTPRPWPGPEGLWIDLATGGLGRPAASQPAELTTEAGAQAEDVLYLPPVAEQLREARDRIALQALERGVAVLAQFLPGQSRPPEGCRLVLDLSPGLFSGGQPRLTDLSEGAAAVWPLVAGLTAGRDFVQVGLEALVASGIPEVQGIVVELGPAERRRLAELGDEATFDLLFHGDLPSEREFASVAATFGFRPFSERPLPADWRPERDNRRLSAELAVVGELWLRVGRPEAAGQAFYRDSRWVDREPHDLGRLCREGNLGVVSWLAPASREVIEELVLEGGTSLRQELELEYLGQRSE